MNRDDTDTELTLMQQPRRARRLAGPFRLATVVLASGVLLAACSGAGAGSTPPSSAPASSAPSSAPASQAPASQATGAVTIQVASSPLGQILTDQDGNTVYAFTADSANTSSCTGSCIGLWPPVTVGSGSSAQAGTGLTGTLGTITRDDGTVQVTVNQQPIYYYAGDTAPGDVTGQNVGGKWFVVGADGSMIQAAPSASGTPEPTLNY